MMLRALLPPWLVYLWPAAHADLVQQFVAREWHSRYRQSLLGSAWALITPLLTLAVYTFVFRQVFKLRWPEGGQDSNVGFALRIYAGLALFQFFAECVNRAPNLVLEQPHLVKKVVFPLEILAWVSTCSALVHLGIAWCILVLGLWWTNGAVAWTVVVAPLVWLPLVALATGLGWFFAAIGTFWRDIGQLLSLALSLLMFLSPIFFPFSALPVAIQPWAQWNPLALPITLTRTVMIDGQWPDWSAWAWYSLACMAVTVVGARFFAAARKGFADVL